MRCQCSVCEDPMKNFLDELIEAGILKREEPEDAAD